jgi:hypothetical protein
VAGPGLRQPLVVGGHVGKRCPAAGVAAQQHPQPLPARGRVRDQKGVVDVGNEGVGRLVGHVHLGGGVGQLAAGARVEQLGNGRVPAGGQRRGQRQFKPKEAVGIGAGTDGLAGHGHAHHPASPGPHQKQAQQAPGVGPEVNPLVAARQGALPQGVALHHHAAGAAKAAVQLEGGPAGEAQPGQEFFNHREGKFRPRGRETSLRRSTQNGSARLPFPVRVLPPAASRKPGNFSENGCPPLAPLPCLPMQRFRKSFLVASVILRCAAARCGGQPFFSF